MGIEGIWADRRSDRNADRASESTCSSVVESCVVLRANVVRCQNASSERRMLADSRLNVLKASVVSSKRLPGMHLYKSPPTAGGVQNCNSESESDSEALGL